MDVLFTDQDGDRVIFTQDTEVLPRVGEHVKLKKAPVNKFFVVRRVQHVYDFYLSVPAVMCVEVWLEEVS